MGQSKRERSVGSGKKGSRPLLGTIAIASALVMSTAGCRMFSDSDEDKNAPSPIEQGGLLVLVRSYVTDFSTVVESTSNRAIEQIESPETQRLALVWKMKVITLARSYLVVEDPRIAFVDLWSLTEQVRLDATTEETVGLFGPSAVQLEEKMTQLNRQIRRIAGTFLTEEQVKDTERSIEAFAADSEIGERFFAYHRTKNNGEELGSFLTGMVQQPLSALNPFGGVSETAVAIHDVAGSADRMRDVVAQMPDDLRWQWELIFHDLRNSPELQRTLASVESITSTSQDFAAIAREMPAEIRGEVEALLTEVGEAQVDLRTTLGEVQQTLDQVQPLLESTEDVTVSLTAAGAALEKTFIALDTTMVTILGTPEARAAAAARRDPNKKSEPFRILDYAETADSLTRAAEELRGVLNELQGLTGGEKMQAIASTVDQTTTTAVDHIVLRIGQLILAATACALLLRFMWGRLGSTRSS